MKRLTAVVAAIASIALALHAAADAGPPPDRPSGKVVLSVSFPERVAVVDLRSGRSVEKRLPGGTLCHGPVLVTGSRIVYSGSAHGEPVAIGLGLRGHARSVVRSGMYLPSATGGRLWIGAFRSNRWMDLRSLREVTLDGRTTLRARGVPPRNRALEGAFEDGLLFEGGARLRVWDPRLGRVTRRLGGSFPIAMHGRHVAWCRGGCHTLHLSGPDGDTKVQALHSLPFGEGRGGAFSPNGRLLALRAGAAGRLALVDAVTRSARLVPDGRIGDYDSFGWSPDGRWLFIATQRGRLLAYRPGSKHPLTLRVRLHDQVMSVAGA